VREVQQRPLSVAVGTDNGITSDVRFSELRRIDIYRYDEESNSFVFFEQRDIRGSYREKECDKKCEPGSGRKCLDEGFLKELAELIGDCEYLILETIGVKASRVMLRNGISVLEKGGEIYESLLLLSLYLSKRKRAEAIKNSAG